MNTHIIELLETRIAPSTIFVVDTTNNLKVFDSATPDSVKTIGPITGLVAGEGIIGLDFNAATGDLLGLGSGSHIYTINPATAVATQFGPSLGIPINGGSFGFDVNPVSGGIRIVSDTEQNLRVVNNNTNMDNALAFASGDSNFGINPTIAGAAYTNNFLGAPTTTLFAIDSGLNVLVRQGGPDGVPSPNSGLLTTIGALGVDPGSFAGFDIRSDGVAFAALQVGILTSLYTIDLETGAATLVDTIDNGAAIRALAAVPAEVTLVNARTATYRDVDGDKVTITVTKGTLSIRDFELRAQGGVGFAQLQVVDLRGFLNPFDGTDLRFTVKKASGGDGFANVGFIQATEVDLNRVIVKGDLGRIIAGDTITADDPGVNLLQVRSMGTFGTVTQGGTGDLGSIILGSLGALKVTGDFTDAFLSVGGGPDDAIGSISIGGDLIGGTIAFSGRIVSSGPMGDVKIGGNLIGGDGVNSGLFGGDASTGKVRIGGGVIGGAGTGSGHIYSGAGMGDVQIGGDLIGGPGSSSGVIRANAALGNVRIGGDVIGGAGNQSGQINGTGIGAVRISGDLIGGGARDNTMLFDSGVIFSDAGIVSVTLGGSLITGTAANNAVLVRCGAIIALDAIGAMKIGRSIIGNDTHPAQIIAMGQAVKPVSGFDLAIASLTVGGDVRFARILAGFNAVENPANADASIGAVKVTRDWVASSIVAGAQDTGASGFGVGDTLQAGADTALIARIASITIKGDAAGSLAGGDQYGFVAQQIDKLSIAGRKITLTTGSGNDNVAIAFTDDVHLLEVN